MRKIITLIVTGFLCLSGTAQEIDATLPDKIGVGTHASVIKSLSSLLGVALRSHASADVLRYKHVTSVEYHNGTNWVAYSTTDWKHVLDSYDGNAWNIPYNEVRLTIDLKGTWIRPSAFLLAQDWHNGERAYSLMVESSPDEVTWSQRLAPTASGQSHFALNIFMLDYQTEVDRYIRLTISSSADNANPLKLCQISAFTKRWVGLAGGSSLPFYTDFDRHIGIGTTNTSGYQLSVGGKIRAEEVKVEATPWPDYVFSDEYDLPELHETEAYIQQHKHLPGLPSAAEVEANGLNLGEMNARLLEKIEELTLYQIEMMKLIQFQQKRIELLEQKK